MIRRLWFLLILVWGLVNPRLAWASTWTQIFTHDYTSLANASPPGNGWTDVASAWQIGTGVFAGDKGLQSNGSPGLANWLDRAYYNGSAGLQDGVHKDERVVATCRAFTGGTNYFLISLRTNLSNHSGVAASIGGTRIDLWNYSGSAYGNVATQNVALGANDHIQVDFSVVGYNPAQLSATFTDLTSSTNLGTLTFSDSQTYANEPGTLDLNTQDGGVCYNLTWYYDATTDPGPSTGYTVTAPLNRQQAINTASGAFTVATSPSGSWPTTQGGFTVTLADTFDSNAAAASGTFTGVTGSWSTATATLTYASQTATATYTDANNVSGAIQIASTNNNSFSNPASNPLWFDDSGVTAPVGNVTQASLGSSVSVLKSSGGSGGTGGGTDYLYASTVEQDVPVSAGYVANPWSATFSETPAAGVLRLYYPVHADSGASRSVQRWRLGTAIYGYVPKSLPSSAALTGKTICIGYIGTSESANGESDMPPTSPPYYCTTQMASRLGGTFFYDNEGHGGSFIGTSDANGWQPGASSNYYSTAKTNFTTLFGAHVGCTEIISIEGWTNDAFNGSGNAVASTISAYQTLITQIRSDFPSALIMINTDPHRGGAGTSINNAALRSYYAQYSTLTDGVHVFLGDQTIYPQTAVNTQDQGDGNATSFLGSDHIHVASTGGGPIAPFVSSLTGRQLLGYDWSYATPGVLFPPVATNGHRVVGAGSGNEASGRHVF